MNSWQFWADVESRAEGWAVWFLVAALFTIPANAVFYSVAPDYIGWPICVGLTFICLTGACAAVEQYATRRKNQISARLAEQNAAERRLNTPSADPNHVMQSNAEYYDAITESRS